MKNFECITHGKWILVGEHAVIRGAPAVVFPFADRSLKLSYTLNKDPLHSEFYGPRGEELRLLFWGVLEHAFARLDVDRRDLRGLFRIESDLPIGGGLGASAALCVAVGRFCASQGWVRETELYDFSRSLENLFHGQSSGVDIAVVLKGKPLRFQRGEFTDVNLAWTPEIYLSYCGSRGVTAECVERVGRLKISNPKLSERLDTQMADAVKLCEQALSTPKGDVEELARAMDLARQCFEEWGLVKGDLETHMDFLKSKGAKAVKPTGSGAGGHVLSLWDKAPDPALGLNRPLALATSRGN